MSHRSRVLTIAVLAGLACAVICAALTTAIAWNRAREATYDQLTALTDRAVGRLQITITDLQTTFDTLEAQERVPCSPEHIAQMRALVLASRAAQEIGFIEGGYLRCTSSGVTPSPLKVEEPDLLTARGYGVNFLVDPDFVTGEVEMMVLRRREYSALIMPSTYVDIVPPNGYILGFGLPDGRIVASTDPDHNDALAAAILANRRGEQGEYLSVGTHESTWSFAALAPKSEQWERVRAQVPVLLPIGLLASALLVGLVALMASRRVSMGGELAAAIRSDRLTLRYQPIVDLATSSIAGAEVLVRWPHADGTEIPPDAFIAVAEQTGIIRDVTAFVIRRAFVEMKDILSAHPGLHLSVNLSAADMEDDRVLNGIAQVLAEGWLLPQQVWLEVTERAFLDAARTRDMVERARAMGLIVAIDDFGTGYSSLAYLRDTPLDILKIDRTFVSSLGKGAATSGVTQHIIAMARTLGLGIVAEGIETEEQAAVLRSADVEYGQGWLFSKPLRADEFMALLRTKSPLAGKAWRAAAN